jgi:hypothetical protein
MTEYTRVTDNKRSIFLVAGGSVLLAILGTLGVLFWIGWLRPPQLNREAMVHKMGHHVMPFDLSKTMHIFEMTESGGIQQVIAKDQGDKEQIALIRQHLQHEAMMFSAGDFSDPISLHGADMPGIKDLAAGAARIKIQYTALPNGAQITFTTPDLHLITAIHRWFGAQLSDHGSDATYR